MTTAKLNILILVRDNPNMTATQIISVANPSNDACRIVKNHKLIADLIKNKYLKKSDIDLLSAVCQLSLTIKAEELLETFSHEQDKESAQNTDKKRERVFQILLVLLGSALTLIIERLLCLFI